MSEKTPRIIDWEAIERDYRAGVRSLREMGDAYGVTHGAIRKRALRDGWVRDLGAKIRAKAESLVSADAVSDPVSMDTKKAIEREIVEVNAQLQASKILEQLVVARPGIGSVDDETPTYIAITTRLNIAGYT